jgi:hypothetical protein
MRWSSIVLLSTCLVGATSCSRPAEEASAEAVSEAHASDGVRMDAEAQARMGVQVAPVTAASAPRASEGFARVMDVGPLAAIESEISAAEASASASEAEYRRLSSLAAMDQAASARSVEAARAQAAADTARAKLAGRRVGLEWGASLERLSTAERARLLTDIAAGRAALLRIDAPGANASVSKASIRMEKGGPAIPASILGPAAAADARLQTMGLLAIVRGSAASTLPTGRLLQAELELGAAETGFLLPEAALVRTDSSVFVYVKSAADVFERRDVGTGRATASGWFITDGFAAGDEIVNEGAGSLLAVERGPAEAE